jgi:hypothetical protein
MRDFSAALAPSRSHPRLARRWLSRLWTDLFHSMKAWVGVVVAAMALPLGLLAAPAGAQKQDGLVNVNVSDIQVMAQVPVGVAANICPGVNAASIAQEFRQTTDPVCDAESTQFTRGQ